MLFSVDHHRGSEELQAGWPDHDPEVVDHATGPIDTLPWARRTLRDAGLEDDVVLVVGESVDGRPGVARAVVAAVHRRRPWRGGGVGGLPRLGCPRWPWAARWPSTTCSPTPKTAARCRTTSTAAALTSGEFEESGATGSLRLLRRCSAAP